MRNCGIDRAFCAKAKLQTLIMKVMQAKNVSAVRNRARSCLSAAFVLVDLATGLGWLFLPQDQYCTVSLWHFGVRWDMSQTLRSAVEHLFDSLSVMPSRATCAKCSSELLHLNATFFSSGGKIWSVPLPACPKCDLKEDTAKFVSPQSASCFTC